MKRLAIAAVNGLDRLRIEAQAVFLQRLLDATSPRNLTGVPREFLILQIRDMYAITAAFLREVTGDVRKAHRLLCIHPRIDETDHADTDAGRKRVRSPMPGEIRETRTQALCHCFRGFVRALAQQDAKFVAAQPREHIVIAQAGLKTRRDFAQHRVARCVSKRIVDDLELIQIEQHHRAGMLGFVVEQRRLQRQCEPAFILGAIPEPGQSVMRGLPGEIQNEFPFAHHASQHQHDARRGLHLVGHDIGDGLHRDATTIRTNQNQVVSRGTAVSSRQDLVRELNRSFVFLINQLEHRTDGSAHHGRRLDADKTLRGRIDELHGAVQRGGHDRLSHRTQHGRGAGFAAPVGLLGPQALQDQPPRMPHGQSDQDERHYRIGRKQRGGGLAVRRAQNVRKRT